MRALLIMALCAFVIPASADAQTRARRLVPAGDVTGLEMGIEGSLEAVPGGRVRWFVSVYEVVRRRELRPSPNTELTVSSSFSRDEPLAEVVTDARGRAAIEVEIPEDLEGNPTLRVEARSPRRVRRVFSVALERAPRHHVELFVDRARSVPNGTVAFFGRVTDRATSLPAAHVEVQVSTQDEPLLTDDNGVFIGRGGPVGVNRSTLYARTEHGEATHEIFAETPRSEALWVQAAPRQTVAQPGDVVPVDVVVRTPTGVPIANARVGWLNQSEDRDPSRRIQTDSEGRARLEWLVARVAGEPVVTVERVINVVDPGRGAGTYTVSLRLARVSVLAAWSVEGGALVPSTPGRVFVRAVRPDGLPAAEVPLTLEAPRLGGTLTAVTDAQGVARFDGVVGADSSSDACGGATAMAAVLVVGELRQRLCLPVDPDATATVRASASADGIEAEVRRVAVVRTAPVELAALRQVNGNWVPLARRVLAPQETRATLALPAGTRGEIWVRARPLVGGGGTARGRGTLVWVGASPDAPRLEVGPERGRIVDPSGTDLIFATQAGSEGPLRQEIATALGPVGAALDRGRSPLYVAALLAARAPSDEGASMAWREGELVTQPLPEHPVQHGLLRDPWRTRARFIRGRVGRLMRAVESYADASIPDSLENVGIREGRGWRFNRAVVEAALARAGLGDETAAALDGEPLDIAALTAMDSSFTYDRVARRITRERLFRINVLIRELVRGRELDRPWALRGDPARLVVNLLEVANSGEIEFSEVPERPMLFDAWGTPLALRRVRGRARFSFLSPIAGWELVSAGPDQRLGTGDDVVDPFARVLPSGGIYAQAVGEDILLARLNGVVLGRATVNSLANVFEIEVPSVDVSTTGARSEAWGSLPAPLPRVMNGAPVTPIHDAIGGRGPAVEWELPSERREYEVTAIRFTAEGAIRTGRSRFIAGAPWVATVDLPDVLRPGERLTVPVTLTRLVDAPRPEVSVEVRGRAVRATLEGDELVLEALRPGLADVAVRVRIDPSTTSSFERRLRVVPNGSLRSREAALWTDGEAELAINTPDGATPWRSRLIVSTPRGLLHDPALEPARERHPAAFAWALSMTDQTVDGDLMEAATISRAGPIDAACALVAQAAQARSTDVVNAGVGLLRGSIGDDLAVRAAVLTALALAATRDPEGSADPLAHLIAELRQDGWRTLARASDRPALMARMAAGLLLADRNDAAGTALLDRVTERLAPDEHGRRWVPGESERAGDAWMGTLALAIAARQVGRDELADELARTVMARFVRTAELGAEGTFWALASSVYGVYGVDGPESVEVQIDGRAQTVLLENGVAEVALAASASIAIHSEAPVAVRAESRYVVELQESREGPLTAHLEGNAGRATQRSGFELVVESSSERDVAHPVVEISLPGAARCDEVCRRRMERAEEVRSVEGPDLAGVLRLHLASVPASSTRRVPLAFSWIASGRTRGLSLTVYEVTVPNARFVEPARELTIEAP